METPVAAPRSPDAAAGTGVLAGLPTPWGLLRHRWAAIKLATALRRHAFRRHTLRRHVSRRHAHPFAYGHPIAR
jgi:hypothetical protein